MNQLLAAAILLAGQTSGDGRPTPGELKLPKTNITLIHHVQLPARQAGVLKALALEDGTLVQEGMPVKRGQLLGLLDDEDALARQKAAEAEHRVSKAEKEKAAAGISAAKATIKVADAEVAASRAINARAPGSVTAQEMRRQELTVDRATAEATVSEKEEETAALTIEAKQAQLEVAGITVKHHRIESPLDGVIVQMYHRTGEWVSPGDPIMRVVFMDRLRVEGFVNAERHTAEEIHGKAVEVAVNFPNGRIERFSGTIGFVSPLVEASGDFRVWCEVDNRQTNGHWVLRPGMTAEMTIKLNSVPSKVAVKN